MTNETITSESSAKVERENIEPFVVDVEPGPSECVDERKVLGVERKNHIKLPGASVHVADMFEIAFHKAGIDTMNLPQDADGQAVDAKKLVQMVKAVHATEKAKEIGFEFGVHIDDEHGHITNPQELEKRDEGCGHDRVRQHSLLEAHGVRIPDKRAHLVGEMIKAGASVTVYTEGHFKDARAVENHRKGKTLSSQQALNAEMPAFDSDVWVIADLANEIAEQVRNLGGDYEKAAGLITSENLKAWSNSSYRETLRDLGGPADNIEVIE